MEIVKQIILPNRPPKNPIPGIVDGGDCGACVLAGLLGISVPEAYELHCSGEYYGGSPIPKQSTFNYQSMIRTLESLTCDWRTDKPKPLEHVVTDIPLFPFDYQYKVSGLPFGFPSTMQYNAWQNYARALLSGGYYGIAMVYNNGFKGEIRHYGETDHWVMICGWRNVYIPESDEQRKKSGCIGSYNTELLIGNSAKSSPQEDWVDYGDFLKFWGGFSALWAKPSKSS